MLQGQGRPVVLNEQQLIHLQMQKLKAQQQQLLQQRSQMPPAIYRQQSPNLGPRLAVGGQQNLISQQQLQQQQQAATLMKLRMENARRQIQQIQLQQQATHSMAPAATQVPLHAQGAAQGARLTPQQMQQLKMDLQLQKRLSGLANQLQMQPIGRPAPSQQAPIGPIQDGAAHNIASREQRKLALACIALQLARGGVSVDQAMKSGMMSGMSVVDIRFIAECYNAERLRMQGAEAGETAPTKKNTAGFANTAIYQSAGSPASSMYLFDTGSSSPSSPHPARSVCTSRTSSIGASTAAVMEMANSLPGDLVHQQALAVTPVLQDPSEGMALGAFNYGFFGNSETTLSNILLEDSIESDSAMRPGDELDSVYTGQSPFSLGSTLDGNVTIKNARSMDGAAEMNQLFTEKEREMLMAMVPGPQEEETDLTDEGLDACLANLDLGSGFY
eukprot:gene24303-9906_t